MSLSTAQLEGLLNKLENLAAQLRSSSRPAEAVLTHDDPVVGLANDCEFMLPSPLTAANLLDTVERKINNVLLLRERASQNQEIPADAQFAADNEDTLIRPSSSM